MGVLVPLAIGVESTLIAVKSTQQVPEDIKRKESGGCKMGTDVSKGRKLAPFGEEVTWKDCKAADVVTVRP